MDKSKRAALAALAVTVCAIPPALQAGSIPPLVGFVVLGQTDTGSPFALARVVIDQGGADCPSLEPASGKGDKHPMTARKNPDPDNFDVTVCEAVYPTDGSRINVHGASLHLPAVPQTLAHVAVFGDTGCKPSDQKGCEKNEDWPFGEMADAATRADPAPDLVLHMGDYNYRATPGSIKIKQADGKTQKVSVYDAGDNTPSATCTLSGPYYGQNSIGSDSPDSWKPWKQDFFEPAAKLLAAAPWVFARGNHELCSRAGPGFFYFLDPGSDLVPGSGGARVCPPAEEANPLTSVSPTGSTWVGI